MFQAAIAANFYEDLSEHNVCPSILKDKIIFADCKIKLNT